MNKNIIYRLDWTLMLIYLLLLIFGVVNVYSATFTETSGGLFDMTQAIGKQLLFIIFSLFIGIIILTVDSKFFEQFATLAYSLSIVLLLGLFVFGKTVSGATSWYNLGGISFQPSELAKVTTALIIASLLSKFQSDLKTWRTIFKIGAYILFPFILIILQPDPGSALVFGAFFFPLFREGLNYAYLIIFLTVFTLFFVTLSFPFVVVIGNYYNAIFFNILYFQKDLSKSKNFPFSDFTNSFNWIFILS